VLCQLETKNPLSFKKNGKGAIVAELKQKIKFTATAERMVKLYHPWIRKAFQNTLFDKDFFHPSFSFKSKW
jgi:hypothetical protein